MKFSDWLWCKAHNICTKHLVYKRAGKGGSHCKQCLEEYWQKRDDRLKGIQNSHFRGGDSGCSGS